MWCVRFFGVWKLLLGGEGVFEEGRGCVDWFIGFGADIEFGDEGEVFVCIGVEDMDEEGEFIEEDVLSGMEEAWAD